MKAKYRYTLNQLKLTFHNQNCPNFVYLYFERNMYSICMILFYQLKLLKIYLWLKCPNILEPLYKQHRFDFPSMSFSINFHY